MKLWISPTDFVELDRQPLTADIAVRSRSLEWMGMFGLLPDPDPVLRKLGQDLTVYRELTVDAHVFSCLQSRKAVTLSKKWELRENPRGSSGANRRALALCEDIFADLDVRQVIIDMLEAPFYGMAPVEITWESAGRQWIPRRVEGKPPEWFAFDDDNRLRFISREAMIDGELVPEGKFLLARHGASYQNPYGERVLARCFWPVVFKRGGFKFWAIFTEKFGMPWVRGKVPRATNDTERSRLLGRLVAMVQDAVAVINDDESVEITEAAGKSASADIYERLVGASNREVSKAILGQTLTTELDQKGGSRAATSEHMEVRDDLGDQDQAMVVAEMNRLLSWITELNVSGAMPPVFAFVEEEDVQNERAERDGKLHSQDVDFTPAYYQRTYNLEPDDFTMRRRATGPPPAFAEGARRFSAEQQALESLADDALAQALPGFAVNEERIREAIEGAASFAEAIERLQALAPELDADALALALEQSLFAAEMFGRFTAGGER